MGERDIANGCDFNVGLVDIIMHSPESILFYILIVSNKLYFKINLNCAAQSNDGVLYRVLCVYNFWKTILCM